MIRRTYPNPRIDRIIAKPRGRLLKRLGIKPRTRVLRGAPTTGARMDNMLGVRAVPDGWEHVGDVLVPPEQTARVESGVGDIVGDKRTHRRRS